MPHWQPANDDLPASGVSPGTYGDATHSSRVTVDAAGRVTAASSVAITGGGGGGAWTLISSGTLAVAAASIDIASIPATYNHLYLVVIAHGDAAALEVNILLRFNADAGGNYDGEDVFSNNASPGGAGVNAVTAARIGNAVAATGTASAFGQAITTIPFYAQTTAYKGWITQSGRLSTVGTPASYTIDQWQGQWRSTAAINELTLTPSAGNFIAGTAYTLHGIT